MVNEIILYFDARSKKHQIDNWVCSVLRALISCIKCIRDQQMHINFICVPLLYNGHPEDGHVSGRNMLLTTVQLKYINKIKKPLLLFSTFYEASRCSPGQKIKRFLYNWICMTSPPHKNPLKPIETELHRHTVVISYLF